jgi:hypothetical protein
MFIGKSTPVAELRPRPRPRDFDEELPPLTLSMTELHHIEIYMAS